jgi:hexosaminidase
VSWQLYFRNDGLSDVHELQAYFIQRIEKFLNENGRQLIGWDEILEGGLSPTAAVQSWRGMDGGKQAAETKHAVVMSPTSHCYLDYGLGSIDLEKIYSFDPIPADLSEEFHEYIIGGEGNMWTERVPDKATLDAKVFPRLIGLAEVLWSYPEERDFDRFYSRLQYHYDWLETYYGIDYGLESIGASISQNFEDSSVYIALQSNLPDLTLKYKWKSNTSNVFTDYTEPFLLDQIDALQVQAFKKNEEYGEQLVQNFVNHKGLGKSSNYGSDWNEWYAGNGDKNLVDGRLGSIDFRDGNWQGFWGENIDITIDLGKSEPIMSVGANFYQYANSWIFLPKEVRIELSEDGEIWTALTPYKNTEVDLSNQKRIKYMYAITPYGLKDLPQARYIRLQAIGIGKVPKGHEAEGQDSWLFIDEIMID